MIVDKWDMFFIVAVVVHLVAAPYHKVEESFNLQATHDMLYKTFQFDQYDHVEFPGVVPRTFIGALLVSLLSFPGKYVLSYLGLSKLAVQYLVRFVLGMLVCFSFSRFRHAVGKKWGTDVGAMLMVISAVQFHFPFYASRTLPNTFALILALEIFTAILNNKNNLVIFLVAFVTLVFRSELVLLAGPIGLLGILERRFSFAGLLTKGAISAIISLGITVAIDSVFWQRWLWPEGELLWFNTYLNKSHNYGVAPFYWYFLVAIPKALQITGAFFLYGVLVDIREGLFFLKEFRLFFCGLVFVALYSILPHKELRFICYVFPLFNTVSAFGAAKLYRASKKANYLKYVILVTLLIGLVISLLGFLWVSTYNYPGGHAFKTFHQIVKPDSNVNVHIDVLPAMTGVSKFGETNPNWRYNKTETLTIPEINKYFTHLITSNSTFYTDKQHWSVLSVTEGYHRLKLQFPFPKIETVPIVYILQKNN